MEENRIPLVMQAQKVINQVRHAVVGKDKVLLWVFAAILARGHILLEDIPGVGKTTMALAFSKTLGLDYNRVQFTPDVLPSDITGYSIPDRNTGKLTYQPGAVLCHLFLADELNRATSRTQSALLEAMEEGQVTVDGTSHILPAPFVVMATQNPVGAAGTQLLPDSQLDRFTVCLSLGYPSPKDEIAMLQSRQGRDPLQELSAIMTRGELLGMQKAVDETFVSAQVFAYVVDLMNATREHPLIRQGASPRVSLSVVAMARAFAQLRGRDYVVPKDIQEVLLPTVAHRLLLSPKAQGQGMSAEDILQEILKKVPAPKMG